MACSRAAIAGTELKLGRQRPATSRPSQDKPPKLRSIAASPATKPGPFPCLKTSRAGTSTALAVERGHGGREEPFRAPWSRSRQTSRCASI